MTIYLLVIDTSSPVCDVALVADSGGDVQRYTRSHEGSGEHAERLLPMVNALLDEAGIGREQLSAIVVGQGPGSFTGLRVACGVAQGMAAGLGIGVIPIPSLLAVAARAHAVTVPAGTLAAHHVVLQDARMDEVYLAAYRSPDTADGQWTELQAPTLVAAGQVGLWLDQFVAETGVSADETVWLSGDAMEAYPQMAAQLLQRPSVRRAEALRAEALTMADLGLQAWHRDQVQPVQAAVPLYVRDKVAFTTHERTLGAGGNPRAPAIGQPLQPMMPGHLDAVAGIESRVQSFPWSRRNFADCLQAGYPAWVIMQQGQVAGYYIAMMAPDVAHLLVIGVDPAYQGKGLGRAMLDHCEKQAQYRQLDTVVLEVRESNDQAIGFYRHQGYSPCSVRKEYYPGPHNTREDACVMRKQLAHTQAP